MDEAGRTERGLDARIRIRRSSTFELDVQLVIPPGKSVALLGPNGAGKSTAVAAISGILAIDSGRIDLAGMVLDDPEQGAFVPPERRQVGVVFQDYLLFPHLTALDNVAFGLRSRGVTGDRARARAKTWMATLGLEGLEDRKPRDLSGGQAQRVALARALAIDPRLLLLDEPLSALDVATRARLRWTLAEHLAGFEGPRLLITHDPAEAFLLADEICVIEAGAITQIGSVDDIRLRPRTPYVAELAGSNFLRGIASGGEVDVGGLVLRVSDTEVEGPVVVTIRSSAISLHMHRPEGSHRNSWMTQVSRVERLGATIRLLTGPPLPLTVDITRESLDAMGLRPNSPVWAAIKATEIAVQAGASDVDPIPPG